MLRSDGLRPNCWIHRRIAAFALEKGERYPVQTRRRLQSTWLSGERDGMGDGFGSDHDSTLDEEMGAVPVALLGGTR